MKKPTILSIHGKVAKNRTKNGLDALKYKVIYLETGFETYMTLEQLLK